MASWQNPAEGYTTFSSAASDLMGIKTAYDGVITVADTGKSSIATAWTGEGSTVLQSNVQVFRDSIPPIQEVLDSAKQAIEDYKTTLDSIAQSAEPWLTQYNNMNHLLNQPDRNVFTDPAGATEDAADRVVNFVRFNEAQIALQGLYTQRRSADSAVIAALAASMPDSWADQSAAFTSAGITQSMLLSATDSEQAMIDLAQRMLDGDMSDENIAALTGLLSVWNGNATTMSNFFQTLGGGNAAQLIDQLSREMSYESKTLQELGDGDQAILTLADYIRSGLSTGSENWTPEYADTFMRDMLTGNVEYFEARKNDSSDPSGFSAQAQAVSFYFSDPERCPMPEPLATAAAELVDEIEREGGSNSLLNFVNPDSGIGANVFGLYSLDGEYTGEMSQMDLPGRVFETLGLYPDASLEFLTADEDRVDYWFGERDWSYADGFAGPGGLWMGAAAVPGEDSAATAAAIMAALGENPTFTSENLSDQGAANLAGAIAIDLPGMVEYSTTNGSEGVDPGAYLITLFGSGSETFTPGVSMDVLAEILGVVGATDPGAIIINETATNYQNAYYAYGLSDPAAFNEAMRQSNALQGVIDGAGIGETIAAADRSDERREQMIDDISMLVGAIPIPAVSGVIVNGGLTILDYTQELLVSAGEDALLGTLSGNEYNEALTNAGATETTLAEAREFANGANLYTYLQTNAGPGLDLSAIEAPPTRDQFSSDEAFINGANSWYQDNKPELDAAGQTAFNNPYFELDIVLQAYTAQVGDAEGEQLQP